MRKLGFAMRLNAQQGRRTSGWGGDDRDERDVLETR